MRNFLAIGVSDPNVTRVDAVDAKTLAEGLPRSADEVDPDLVALPAPARGRRLATMTLMALVVAASIALLAGLRADIAYFFAEDDVLVLGAVTEVDPASLESNTFVSVDGHAMASRTVHYSRMLGGSYAVFPLAGQRRILAHVPADEMRGGRADPRTTFSGRLVTVGELGGRFTAVKRHFEASDFPITRETFVVMVDEPPGTYLWALGVGILALLFVFANLLLLMRWFRPIRVERRASLA